jgi:hypothetical protein
MMEEIMEEIEIEANFSSNKIKPKWFLWNNRKYYIDKVNYIWHNKDGEEVIYYFSVIVGADLYELSFYTKKLKWLLSKVYIEG